MTVHICPNLEAITFTDSSVYMWSWGTLRFKTPGLAGDYVVRIRVREDGAGDDYSECSLWSYGYTKTFRVTTQHFSVYEFQVKMSGDSIHYFSFNNDYPQERNVELSYCEFCLLNSLPDTSKVRVSWDRNIEPDLAGYRVHFGFSPRDNAPYPTRFEVGLDTFLIVTGLAFNKTLYFAATAYDTANNESDFSKEVSIMLTLRRKGDYNGDYAINLLDLIALDTLGAYGTYVEDPRYIAVFDFNDDKRINLLDLIALNSVYGETYVV